MKNIIKTIASVLALATLFVAGTALAASVNDGPIKTLKVTDATLSNSSWGNSVSVQAGDQVSFQLHYYLEEGESTSDMRFSLEDLDGVTFSAGDSETVNGRVSATGLDSSSDTVSMNFSDSVRFNLYNVSWQIYPCQSVGCEESTPSGYQNVLTNSGMSIGDVDGTDSHYTGNVIVTFKTTAVNNPVDDNVEVDTNSATNVGENSATLRGEMVDGENVEAWFALSTGSNPSCNSGSQRISVSGSFDQGDTFARSATGLNDDTTYYYRACGEGDNGDVVSGTVRSFTTDEDNVVISDDVEVETKNASNVEEDSAQLNGEVTEGDNVRVWFAFDDASSVSCFDSSDRLSVSGSYDDGQDFDLDVSNLDDDTTYYYRACAEDNNGDAVAGDRVSFRTDDDNNSSNNDDVDVETEDAEDVDENSAVLVGEVTDGDDISVWFVYDEDDDDLECSDRGNRVTVSGLYDDGDMFEKRVTGLDENERYYFRACAENEDGDEAEGSIEDFRTDDDNNNGGDGDISTLSPTDINDDSAELRGRVEDGDNLRVWFAFSTGSGPSCNSSSQRISVSGTHDEDDVFEREVSGLNSGTTYYYRACTEDEDGDLISGSVRNFRTDGDTTNPSVDTDPVAITQVPSGITTTSARFNATVVGDDTAVCYFEYGRTTALGLTTTRQSVDLDTTSSCSSTRFGLSSGTTYYYRAVVEQDGETFRGLTRNFRTNSVIVVQPPVVVNPGNPQPPVVVAGPDLEITKWVSAETDPEFDIETEATRGEAVYYRVRVENNSDETITDITVTDQIPYYLELDGQRSLDDDADKEVVWFIDSLRANRSRTFITEMRVREDAITGDEIFSFATMEYDDEVINSNDVIIEIERGSIDILDIDEDEEVVPGQAANIFGAGFLPTTLFGWLLLLIAILIIAFLLARILFVRTENKRILEELRSMQK